MDMSDRIEILVHETELIARKDVLKLVEDQTSPDYHRIIKRCNELTEKIKYLRG